MLTALLFTLFVAQDPHQAMNDRGAMAMGFDQHATTHHFYLYGDGGTISIGANDPSDTKNRDAIRSHLPHITVLFGNGDFDVPMLVHDSANVPGTKVMAARKQKITYRYVETPSGGRVDIVTSDKEALAAVHDFLKYQIKEHQTGDPLTASKRK
jgi:hypothetical protein